MTIKILASGLQSEDDAVFVSDDGIADIDVLSIRIGEVIKLVPLIDFIPAVLAFDIKRSKYYETNTD